MGSIVAVITGNMAAKPELKYSQDGTAFTQVSIAVNKKRKGEETTTWFRVSIFRQSAEFICEYGDKGALVQVVVDNMTLNEYTDKQGEKRSSLECVASSVQLLGGKGNSEPKADYAPPVPNGQDIPF